MFVLYGPIGDGPEWRATRGAISEDFPTSAAAFAGAMRLAGGVKGKIRRTRFLAPAPPPAPAPEPEPEPEPEPAPAWEGMTAKELAQAIKAGDLDEHLDAIEAAESRKSVIRAINGRR